MDFALSQRAHRAVDQPITFLMAEALKNPGLISLAAGFVDDASLPCDASMRIFDRLLRDAKLGQAALQYGTTRGDADLRHLLFEHLARLDGVAPAAFPGSADDIVVTTGSQQMLHLLTDMLVDPGDIVITEWPSYFVYTATLSAFGAVVRSVDMDEHGLVPERLGALLDELAAAGALPRVKIVYTCSAHQNPTGLTLAEERRAKMLNIVERYSERAGHRILIIEDAAYRELTYDGPPAKSIKRHDADNRFVALCHTFSKPFAPGFKTGYGLLPHDLVDPVLLSKGGRDFGSANLCQHVLREAMAGGAFDDHVVKLHGVYRGKRDAMLAALQAHLGDVDGVSWTRPTGGLYIWLTLPPTVDTGRHGPLFSHAVREGVLFVPGEFCYPPDPTRQVPHNTIRLSFGVASEERIRHGIERLANAVRAATGR